MVSRYTHFAAEHLAVSAGNINSSCVRDSFR
jgi:hypothetical protein